MDNKFLDQIALAARWDMSHKTLQQWRWRGTGPRYVKLSNKMVRYPIADIEVYEASKNLKSTSDEYLKKNQYNRSSCQ